MKKKLKLKKFVIPIFSFILLFVFTVVVFLNNSNNKYDNMKNINYVSDVDIADNVPVVSIDKTFIKPYELENVKIGKYFYNYKESSDSQQNSIIFYDNSYIQNSGVDYIYDKTFDVIASYDGTVLKVEENDLVGKIVEIKHDNNIITVYQSLSDIQVKEGDIVSQGDVIASSGKSKINSELGNHIHFEIYIGGEVVDPLNCFGKKISELS